MEGKDSNWSERNRLRHRLRAKMVPPASRRSRDLTRIAVKVTVQLEHRQSCNSAPSVSANQPEPGPIHQPGVCVCVCLYMSCREDQATCLTCKMRTLFLVLTKGRFRGLKVRSGFQGWGRGRYVLTRMTQSACVLMVVVQMKTCYNGCVLERIRWHSVPHFQSFCSINMTLKYNNYISYI